MSLFWFLLGMQIIWWLFLSLTRTGKIITVLWVGIVTISWLLSVYFNYFPLALSGDIKLGIFAIEATILSGTNLLLQLVIPPWVGLIAGTVMSQENSNPLIISSEGLK